MFFKQSFIKNLRRIQTGIRVGIITLVLGGFGYLIFEIAKNVAE